ncbi:UNVERIFIED_CONTAM: hypothetical protein Sradi_1407700 [Sesamum radiatum]|uniref:Uncharacterized protein n=1 Tax=Sesamum radiatum TaxID=300843 RepID=A0AAW2UTY8_SESRA
MDSDSQSPGVCQRLIDFILSVLNGSTVPPGLVQVPIEGDSSRNGKSSARPIDKHNGYVDSGIVIEFRHKDGSESWTQINERGDSVRAPKRDGLLPNGVDRKERNKNHFAPSIDHKIRKQVQGKELQELEASAGRDARSTVLKKNVTVKESEVEVERVKTKEATRVNNQPHEDTKPRTPRRLGPLLSMASNINEKSDAYIQRRKKAMSRNYSLDPERS